MKKENSLQSFCERQDRMYLLQEWNQEKNAPLTPDTVHKGSHQKVWWQCPEGHIWKAVVHSRTGAQRCGCPVCAGKVKPSRETQYRQALVQAALANRQKPV